MNEGLLSKCKEVTLQESTAANPEYGDFLCALEAGGLWWGFPPFLTLLVSVHGPSANISTQTRQDKTIATGQSTRLQTN